MLGPGQDASMASHCSDDRSLSTSANTSLLAPTRIRPLLTSRCFIANRSKTAPSSKGSQLSPHTPSAGHATTPPAHSDVANCDARQRECNSGPEFNAMPVPHRRQASTLPQTPAPPPIPGRRQTGPPWIATTVTAVYPPDARKTRPENSSAVRQSKHRLMPQLRWTDSVSAPWLPLPSRASIDC